MRRTGLCLLVYLLSSVAMASSFFGASTNNTLGLSCTNGQVPEWNGTAFTQCLTAAGSGTVTSVGLLTDTTTSGIFANTTNAVTGSPVTASGSFTLTLLTHSANTFLAGPVTGVAAAPTFRGMVAADLPLPTTSSVGGVEAYNAVSHQWINAISTSGVPSSTQPAFTDISGTATLSQLPTQTGTGNIVLSDSPNFTTKLTFGNYHLEPVEINDGTCTTTITSDLSTGAARKITMGGACTLTLSNPVTGGAYVLKLVEDATGSRTMTWPATVKWAGGTAPTLSGASKTDLVNLYWDGTNYYGSYSLNY